MQTLVRIKRVTRLLETMRNVRLMDGGLAAVLNVVMRKTTSNQ